MIEWLDKLQKQFSGFDEKEKAVSDMIQNEGIYEVCGNGCPPECDSMIYVQTNNYMKLHSTKTNQFGELWIYYNDLNYKETTQSANIDSSEAFAVIGGILSLFLGISFLSFVEVLQLLLSLINIMIKK